MKYTQQQFEEICRPLATGLDVDLTLGPADAHDYRSLSRLCANRLTHGLAWGVLGARINLEIIRKSAGKTFSDSTRLLKLYLLPEYYNFVMTHADRLDSIVSEANSDHRQAISVAVLEANYLLKYNKCGNCKQNCPQCEKFYVGETPEQLYMRVATFLCMAQGDDDLEKSFEMIKEAYNLLSAQKYSHATPTMYNAGTVRHQMASCFVLVQSDSLWGIEDNWTYVAEISRNSGGIGMDVSAVRHSFIGNSGKSDGVPALIKPLKEILGYVDQSKKRKGSAAMFLGVWHIDIIEFIQMGVPVGNDAGETVEAVQDMFYCAWANDLFMRRCRADESWTLFCPKRSPGLMDVYGAEFEKLYTKYEREGHGLKVIPAISILKELYNAQCKIGFPYIGFSDRFNEANVQENIGPIHSSNLCVAPETMVLTSKGYVSIQSIWGDRETKVWNGQSWSPTRVYRTGTDQPLLEVGFSNGSVLKCTPYHKFFLDEKSGALPAHLLKPGMKLIDTIFSVMPSSMTDPDAWTGVPINHTYLTKSAWLRVLFETMKITVYESKLYETVVWTKHNNCHIKSRDRDFLNDVRYMLQTMGCDPQLYHDKKSGWYRLFILSTDLYILGVVGQEYVKPGRNGCMPRYAPIRVQYVKKLDGLYDTFCFTEDDRGMGIFNGVITGQCMEISLHTSEEEIASCNLASVCLSNFCVDGAFDFVEFARVVRFIVRIMNNVIDRNFYPERIPQIKKTNLKNRPLGIGIQGLANTFAALDILFDSAEARDLNNQIIQVMYYSAVDESANIAAERGRSYGAFAGSPYSRGVLHPDMWKSPAVDGVEQKRAVFLDGITIHLGQSAGAARIHLDWAALRGKVRKGMYNSTLLALMPTATSSIIAEQAPCFEPFNFIIGSKSVLSGQYTHVCREFVQDMVKLGVWSETVCSQVKLDSLGGTASLTVPEKIAGNPLKVARWNFLMKKYLTAYEIRQQALIKQSIDRTPFVCQSQSLNWFSANPSWKKFYKNIMETWERGAKTGLYYNRGKSGMQARNVASCTACSS